MVPPNFQVTLDQFSFQQNKILHIPQRVHRGYSEQGGVKSDRYGQEVSSYCHPKSDIRGER